MIFEKPINTDLIYEPLEPIEPVERQFMRALQEHGFNPPGPIVYTQPGAPVRFDTTKPNRKAGWYFFNESGYGSFGDFSTDISYKFCPKYNREPILEERQRLNEAAEAAQRQAAQLREETYQQTAIKAREEWESAKPATWEHAYLVRKHVGAYGVRTTKDGKTLLIPMYDSTGQLVSLQKIFPMSCEGPQGDFSKRFKQGGKKKGCYCVIGDGTPVYMAEGYATAASIYEATHKAVVIAFDCGNMASVAELFPGAVIVADNDASKAGEKGAEAAAKAHGNLVKLVPVVGMDANDYAVKYGIEALQEFLEPGTVRQTQQTDQPEGLSRNALFVHGDTLLRQGAPRNYIIRGWLPYGPAKMQTFGPSGGGKTFVTLDMMLSSATGQLEWHGQKCKQATIAYLCGEGFGMINRRVAAWASQHGGIAKLEETLRQHFVMSRHGVNLDNRAEFTQLIQELDATGVKPDVIVIDTLATHMQGDENSSQDASTVLHAMDELAARYGATIMYIHHTGQNPETQNRSRGSSAFKGNLDYEFQVEPAGFGYCCVKQTKVKDGPYMPALYFQFVKYSIPGWYDTDGEPETSSIVEPCEKPCNTDEKDQQQLQDERAVNEVVYLYGYIENEELYVNWDDLVMGLYGRLKYTRGKNADLPYPHRLIKQQLYTDQEPPKLADRLISYGYWEPEGDVQEKVKHPARFHIVDGMIVLSYNMRHKDDNQLEQQPELVPAE